MCVFKRQFFGPPGQFQPAQGGAVGRTGASGQSLISAWGTRWVMCKNVLAPTSKFPVAAAPHDVEFTSVSSSHEYRFILINSSMPKGLRCF